jgi:hypothetical protein
LTYEMQKSMCEEVLWRIQCGLDPNGNDPNPRPMDPEYFATCVTEPFKAAERMGIASWWQSYRTPHRAKHCHKKPRCGISSTEKMNQKPKFKPH